MSFPCGGPASGAAAGGFAGLKTALRTCRPEVVLSPGIMLPAMREIGGRQ